MELSPFELVEYEDSMLEELVRFRNTIFRPCTADFWRQLTIDTPHGRGTAAIARKCGRIVGAIPFARRRFRIAPDVTLETAVAAAVGVAEEFRGAGLGSRLMDFAKDMMRPWADAMFVISGFRARAYRFYSRNGFADLLPIQRFVLAHPPHVRTRARRVDDVQQVTKHDERLAAIFHSVFRSFGGHYERGPGFYSWYLNVPFANQSARPRRFVSFLLGDEPWGYLVASRGEDNWFVLEMASLHADMSDGADLLRAAASAAADDGLPLHFCSIPVHPYHPAVEELRFEGQPRGHVLKGQVLSPARVFDKVCRTPPEAALVVRTEAREVVLYEGGSGEIVLDMSEADLMRMLLRRLDVAIAIRRGAVQVARGSVLTAGDLRRVLPCADWAYMQMDYL